MSYKLGLIFSMIFIVTFFLFGVDLINIQFIQSNLDQTAVTIGYLISKQGNLAIIPNLEKQFDVQIVCSGNQYPKFGDVVEFEVKDSFDPLIMSKEIMYVSIHRNTVIGYYN